MARAQAELFAEFAAFFAAPLEAEDIDALRAEGGLGCLSPLLGRPACRAAAQHARAVLAGFADAADATSVLNASFCRLFLGVGGPRGSVPPYESAHRGAGGRLFQEPVAEMAALLEAHGLDLAADCCEPPDHLAVELSLMEALLARPAPDAAAVAALRGRLLGWVPDFAARCAACDPLGFYAALATLLHVLLLEEQEAASTEPERTFQEMGA